MPWIVPWLELETTCEEIAFIGGETTQHRHTPPCATEIHNFIASRSSTAVLVGVTVSHTRLRSAGGSTRRPLRSLKEEVDRTKA